MATSILAPTKPKAPTIIKPPAPAYDFSKDALQPSANRSGLTAQEMGAKAEQQMKDRVIAESWANPGKPVTGGQLGFLQTGTEKTPVTFRAFTYGGTAPKPTTPAIDPNKPATTADAFAKAGTEPMAGLYWRHKNPIEAHEWLAQTVPKDASEAVTGPAYKRPDTSALDAQIEALSKGRSDADIDAELQRNIEGIVNQYDNLKRDTMRKFENSKQEQFSHLASLGTGINPLSSGAQSVATANDNQMNDNLNNIEQQKQVAIKAAKAAAQGQKTEAQAKQLAYLQSKREEMLSNAKSDYEMQRQSVADSVAALNKAAQQAKEDRITSNSERDDARANIKNMFDMLGSSAFDGVSDADLRAMEKTAGLPAGSISKQAKTVKEKELEAKYGTDKNPEYQYVAANKYNPGGFFNKATGELLPFSKAGTAPAATGKAAVSTGGTAKRTSGGGSSSESAKLPKGFEASAKQARADLAAGTADWGAAWNRLKAQYPSVPSSVIDSQLGTQWREAGAYEKYASRKQSFTGKADPLASLSSPPTASKATGGDDLGLSQDELDKMVAEMRKK